MGWEERRGGQVYYKSVRIDGRPAKVYCGKGERAEEEARQVERRRRERQEAHAAREQELAQAAAAEQHLRELRVFAGLLVRAAFLSAGFHEHRGQYRRRRHASHADQSHGSCGA
jgi:hypothetical protein